MRRRLMGFAALAFIAVGARRMPAQDVPPARETRERVFADPAGRLALSDTVLRRAISDLYWRWLATAPCQAAPWQPATGSPAAFERSVGPLRSAFTRRLGPLGAPGGGEVTNRLPLVSTARYSIEFVQHAGRIAPMQFSGYLIRPEGREPTAAAVIVHGFGSLPRQAMGWRYGGAEAIAYFEVPFDHLAIDLAERAYVVFVPWIREDQSTVWPNAPWASLDRGGEMFAARHSGSGLGLTVSQLESVADLIARETGVDSGRVAAIGWEEGADIAGAWAAVDPRVGALVRLMPPLDRRRWRARMEGIQANPGFLHLDCAYDEEALAALTVPRPILYDWSPTDPTFPRHRFQIDTTVVDRARAFYSARGLGGGVTLAGSGATGGMRRARIANWLDARFDIRGSRVVASGETPQEPSDPTMILAARDSVIISVGAAIGANGTCSTPRLDPPSTRDLPAFLAGADRWRAAIARGLRVPAPAARPPRVVSRDTIEANPEFILEWVVTEPTGVGLPLMGLLATPKRPLGTSPGLLTFDANFEAGETFGLGPGGRGTYLKAYARDAARDGIIVFSPVIPAWFGETAHTILAARDPNGITMWGTVLAQARAATDLLLAIPGVDSTRITLQGISFAGLVALYGAALDTRITTLVYSNPINSAKELFEDPTGAILSTWYAPICGTMNLAQQWLIAPRRFIWENGIGDANGYESRPLQAAREVQDVYRDLGIPERFHLLRHGGGHEEAPAELRALAPYRGRIQP